MTDESFKTLFKKHDKNIPKLEYLQKFLILAPINSLDKKTHFKILLRTKFFLSKVTLHSGKCLLESNKYLLKLNKYLFDPISIKNFFDSNKYFCNIENHPYMYCEVKFVTVL